MALLRFISIILCIFIFIVVIFLLWICVYQHLLSLKKHRQNLRDNTYLHSDRQINESLEWRKQHYFLREINDDFAVIISHDSEREIITHEQLIEYYPFLLKTELKSSNLKIKENKELYMSDVNDKNNICAICHDELKGIVYNLKCKHLYHVNCLDDWRKNCPKNTGFKCPYCSNPVEYVVLLPN